ncbi:hypothetical protein G7072_04215 [Nocardioides sp. HDW12B]|uniref:hypothetical protein n=1 Tax=Nocardioides sp. HDW12B TaxID=2714939 RepID=UPI00140A5092|nr:hypothetical protein [Nocardioides sp. HDW12B]QIK65646.1 hypothetical protein G7072_04215 [Nocardioides sp. HDW12B]
MRSTTTYAVRLALAACTAAGLTGCGAGAEGGSEATSPSGDRLDADRMGDVARDPSASADEIVDAGRAVDAAASGDTVLVTYTVDQGTSEGRSAGAWRLYDAEGDAIATERAGVTEEGASTPDVTGLPDGYLLRENPGGSLWHVAADGASEKVARADGPQRARAGDVPLDDGTARLYRPADRTVLEAAPVADRDRQGWTVTDDGVLWQQLLGRNDRVPFERSTPDGRWEPAATYRSRPDRIVTNLALTAVGERIALPLTAEGDDPTTASLVGLLVRDADAAPGSPWQVLAARDVPGEGWWDARLAAVDDTTAAVSTYGDAPYLVDVTGGDGGWTRMPLPTDEEGWVVEFDGGRAHATHSDHADAWVSDDRGVTWDRLPH